MSWVWFIYDYCCFCFNKSVIGFLSKFYGIRVVQKGKVNVVVFSISGIYFYCYGAIVSFWIIIFNGVIIFNIVFMGYCFCN